MIFIKDLKFGDLFCSEHKIYQAISDPREVFNFIDGRVLKAFKIKAMRHTENKYETHLDIYYEFSQIEGRERDSIFLYSYEAYQQSLEYK